MTSHLLGVVAADIIDNATNSANRAQDALLLWGTVAGIAVILAVLVMTRSLPKVFASMILVGLALAAIHNTDGLVNAVSGLLF